MSVATRIDRRKVLQAGAWTVPVISVAAAAPSLAASSDTRSVTGTLTWGVKQSFRRYITGPIASGTITLSDGATQTGGASSTFIWPDGQGTVTEDGAVEVQYAGTVAFYGHSGALDVTISNPLLSVTPAGTGTVTVTYTSTDGATSTLVLADLSDTTVADGGSSVTASNGAVGPDTDGTATTLAETGVVVFSGSTTPGGPIIEFYPAGAPMNAFETTLTDG